MQKNMIDQWFSIPSNYERLRIYTIKALKKSGRYNLITTTEMISNAYIYILGEEIDHTKGNIESLCKGYIKNEIFLPRSKTNYNINKFKYKNVLCDDLSKLDNDLSYEEDTIYYTEDVINDFIKTLCLYDKGIWNIFFTLENDTISKISKYKKLSLVQSSIVYRRAKELEDELRLFIKNKFKDEEG